MENQSESQQIYQYKTSSQEKFGVKCFKLLKENNFQIRLMYLQKYFSKLMQKQCISMIKNNWKNPWCTCEEMFLFLILYLSTCIIIYKYILYFTAETQLFSIL